MSNEIPSRQRRIVKARDHECCVRCGGAGREWHHRRRRAVKLGHDPHCACVGVWLCPTCHRWAHGNPNSARETGFIVSAYEDEPWTVPIKFYGGWRLQDCEGSFTYTEAPT